MPQEAVLIRINSLKVSIDHTQEDVRNAILQRLRIKNGDLISYKPARISIDARKKDNILYVYSIDCCVKGEERILKNRSIKDVQPVKRVEYSDPRNGLILPDKFIRPVVVGFGPAGMICAYKLAEAGLRPIVVERGDSVDERIKVVEEFWKNGKLNTASNVQFGEGGAGTFSDGKLNTMIHDEYGRIREVFRIFIENGADESIMYMGKPHIGTDKLTEIVKNIRERIISLGGEVRFNTKMVGMSAEDGHISGITLSDGTEIATDTVVLAIGHSARDTFEYLDSIGIAMETKPFAVGVRVQHPQELIGKSQYGEKYKLLLPADYKLTYKCADGVRGVYSFCMCPGGFVVNASSEEGRLVVNGMSNHDRSEKTANSAIVVTVDPSDFTGDSVLSGMEFQRRLEERAYEAACGKIPVQYYDDFKAGRIGVLRESNVPNTKGAFGFADLCKVLPSFVTSSIKEAMVSFGHTIQGFDNDDTLFLGVETRTSSPVRINRNERCESLSLCGLYPCGEGAGYAGGITSAGADGLRIYEAVINNNFSNEVI